MFKFGNLTCFLPLLSCNVVIELFKFTLSKLITLLDVVLHLLTKLVDFVVRERSILVAHQSVMDQTDASSPLVDELTYTSGFFKIGLDFLAAELARLFPVLFSNSFLEFLLKLLSSLVAACDLLVEPLDSFGDLLLTHGFVDISLIEHAADKVANTTSKNGTNESTPLDIAFAILEQLAE